MPEVYTEEEIAAADAEARETYRSLTEARVRLLVVAWLDANNLEATKPAIAALVSEIGKIVAS